MKTMRSTLFLLSAATLWAAPVEIGNIRLRDGQQLENVRVVKVEPDGLRLEHRSGVGKVRMEDLPSDLSRRFSLDEETASAWRMEEKKRIDGLDSGRLRAKVRVLTEASRAEQEAQARSQRMSIFDQAKASKVNYAALDEQLLLCIQLWKDAGREDLAARLEEDRDLLKQQEISRPSGLAAENQALAERIRALQNEVAVANGRPATTTVVVDPNRYGRNSYDPYYSGYYQRTGYYYQRPAYYVPGPVIINQSPYCPPTSRPSPSYPTQVVRPVQKMPQASRPITSGNHNPVVRPYQK